MAGDVDIANNKSRLDMSAAGQNISVVTIGSETYVSMDGGTTFIKSDSGASITSGLDTFIRMWDSFQARRDRQKPKPLFKVRQSSRKKKSASTTPTI